MDWKIHNENMTGRWRAYDLIGRRYEIFTGLRYSVLNVTKYESIGRRILHTQFFDTIQDAKEFAEKWAVNNSQLKLKLE